MPQDKRELTPGQRFERELQSRLQADGTTIKALAEEFARRYGYADGPQQFKVWRRNRGFDPRAQRLVEEFWSLAEGFFRGEDATDAESDDANGSHVPIVTAYLDSPRGASTHPRVQDQLLAGDALSSLLAELGALTWEDVDDLRRILERRVAAPGAAPKPNAESVSGARSIRPAARPARRRAL